MSTEMKFVSYKKMCN